MPRPDSTSRTARRIACSVLAATALHLGGCGEGAAAITSAPPRLAQTGLYADFAARTLAGGVLPFRPQYPLWTDGAAKSRWIALPVGTAIDASDPDHWVFPIGTKLWKQFSFGRPVETRFMCRRPDGSWLYVTYLWSDDGTDAVLAPDRGVRGACPTAEGRAHDLPAVADCRACHESARTPVLGFSALQLSPDRDPLAPHAEPARAGDLDLPELVQRGLLRNLPARWETQAPRIAARSERERAALGYLHGNCSSCHNGDGPLHRLGLRLDYPLAAGAQAPAIATALGVASQFRRPGAETRLAAGAPHESVLYHRIAAVDPVTQMPPFGRHLRDREAIALLEQWIAEDLAHAPPGAR